jgi:hypothetical protein
MKTLSIYRFNELSATAQENAITEQSLVDAYSIQLNDDFSENHGHMNSTELGYASYDEYLDVANYLQNLEYECDNYYNAWYTFSNYTFSISEIETLIPLTSRQKTVLELVVDELVWNLDYHGLQCDSEIELPKHTDAMVQEIADTLGMVLKNASDALSSFYKDLYVWNYSENMMAYFSEDEWYWFNEEGELVATGE